MLLSFKQEMAETVAEVHSVCETGQSPLPKPELAKARLGHLPELLQHTNCYIESELQGSSHDTTPQEVSLSYILIIDNYIIIYMSWLF